MPKGASEAIKQNVSRSKIQRVAKPATSKATIQEASAIRGGTGPVREDHTRLPQPAPNVGS